MLLWSTSQRLDARSRDIETRPNFVPKVEAFRRVEGFLLTIGMTNCEEPE